MLTRCASVLTPALLTRMSRRPNRSMHRGNRRFDRRGRADVDTAGHGVRQAVRDAFGAVEIDVGDDHRGAIVGKPLGDDTSDRTGCAGDECDLTVQIAPHVPLASA